MNRILLVEDNESIILGLSFLLTEEGFEAVVAGTVNEAKKRFAEGGYVLVLLDISLPDGDGFALCRWIRERGSIPVIFLTAREEEGDVVKGFDLGACDYVIKPFRNRELISRIRNALRRNGDGTKSGEKVLQCGDIRLNLQTGSVTRKGEEVQLTKLEFRILSSMLSYPGKIFTREELLAGSWDLYGNYVNDNTLSVTIKRLREKLGDEQGQTLQTVRGIGYRINK